MVHLNASYRLRDDYSSCLRRVDEVSLEDFMLSQDLLRCRQSYPIVLCFAYRSYNTDGRLKNERRRRWLPIWRVWWTSLVSNNVAVGKGAYLCIRLWTDRRPQSWTEKYCLGLVTVLRSSWSWCLHMVTQSEPSRVGIGDKRWNCWTSLLQLFTDSIGNM